MKSDDSTRYLALLSHLLLQEDGNISSSHPSSEGQKLLAKEDVVKIVSSLSSQQFSELLALANSHHVIMRTFPRLSAVMKIVNHERDDWAEAATAKENARIQHALSFLAPICESLAEVGNVIVIKSLDHWPDLGNDLDLFSDAEPNDVVSIMTKRFNARPDARSWGDRLANKWNFIIPGLPELVEVHMSRLGQTGEQVAVTESLIRRTQKFSAAGLGFRVPGPEERLIISTLQRMYRHFYIRLCDIADTARLVDSGGIDYPYLKSLSQSAGLWDGLATYLVTVGGYVKSYSGHEIPLPPLIREAAHFGNELVYYRRKFLRIPIFPQAARFYVSEWKRLLLNGELQNTLRLSLLPGLATAAALEMKLTGSDKGIW